MKNLPKTITELRMVLREKERQKIFKWLIKERNLSELVIEIDLNHNIAGYIGTIVCEAKRFTKNRISLPK